MIRVDKKYRTRDGREVRIYAVDGGGRRPVHGAFWSADGRWSVRSWRADGVTEEDEPNNLDLIEVRPRSDIVERLRDNDTTRRVGECYADVHERRQRDRDEAADEIERLRAALEDAAKVAAEYSALIWNDTGVVSMNEAQAALNEMAKGIASAIRAMKGKA